MAVTVTTPNSIETSGRRYSRTMRTTLVTLAAVAAIGSLAACGSSSSASGSTPAAAATGAAAAGATSAGDLSPADIDSILNTAPAARSGKVPTPEGDQRLTLVYILEAVNPGVSTDEGALVKKSVEICSGMLGGASADKLAAQTRQQFTNGAYTPSPEEAQAMDMAITATFCR